MVLTFESVDAIVWCDHSNESSSAVLLHGTICFVGFKKKMKFRNFLEFLFWPLPGVKGSSPDSDKRLISPYNIPPT